MDINSTRWTAIVACLASLLLLVALLLVGRYVFACGAVKDEEDVERERGQIDIKPKESLSNLALLLNTGPDDLDF